MTANSKLTRDQKNMRIEWLSALQFCDGSIAIAGPYTVVRIPVFKNSRMAQFYVSYRAENETKNRRKVGQYHALSKAFGWTGDSGVMLPVHITAMDFANMLNESSKDSFPSWG